MILVQIKTTAYEGDFQNRLVYAPPAKPFVSSVGLDLAVGPLGLNRSVHAEQRPVDAVEISQHFFVDHRQFRIQPDDTVSLALMTVFPVIASAAILAFVELLSTSIRVSFHRGCSKTVSRWDTPAVLLR